MEKGRGIAQDPEGNVITSATITITDYPGPGASTIYSDNSLTPLSNPFTSSSTDGTYEFYAANGRYTATAAKAGEETKQLTDFILFDGAYLEQPTKAATAALQLTQYDAGKKIFITSADGGPGTIRYDVGGGHSDDDLTYCGTKFIINSDPTIYWERDNPYPVNSAWYGDDFTKLTNQAYIPAGTYTLSSNTTLDVGLYGFFGDGYNYNRNTSAYSGTIINGTGGLIFASTTPASEGTTALERIEIGKFQQSYTGTGTALKVDNIIYSTISAVEIDLNNSGAIGIEYDHWGFFSVIEEALVKRFTGTGILISGSGTKHVVRDCNISSTNATAEAGVETNLAGTEVHGGQINVDNSGNGIGVLFNNEGAATLNGGLVDGTLCEADTAVKITGTTHGWNNIVVRNTRNLLGSGQVGVNFDRANYCVLQGATAVSATGGTIAIFGATATYCGVEGDYQVCRSGFTVNASATGSWVKCTSRIAYADRANLTTDSNLTVIAENVEYVGRTIHNGIAWDKHRQNVADDAAIAITPPEDLGQIKISTGNATGEFILASYNVGGGNMESLLIGSEAEVNVTDGTLTGTTGTDTKIIVRCDSTSGDVYIENRLGATRSIYIEFSHISANL